MPDVVDKSDAIMAALARATDRTQDLGSAGVKISTVTTGTAPVGTAGTYSWGGGYAFDVEMDTKAARMQPLQDAPTMRMLFVDGAYYYDIDPQPLGPLKGKEWMRVDASAVFGEKGAQAFNGGGGGSPAASMRSLKYADDVEDLGKETVDGQSTTHYAASITGGATSMTMDFEKFGKTAVVKAPPAAETGDLTEAVKGAAGKQ
ncbi:hypothetical protein ACIRP7_01595 [Streptomyces sp. NPDC102270]|uniref:hypothetical protein n=1 Tax=Streptomyces sp. NPDC102270 TaxID=3366150 RepID=UPI00382EAC7E